MDRYTARRLKPTALRLGFFNANGLKSQRDEIATFLRDHRIDVMLIQESFLKPHVRDPKIANYRLVRNDRSRCHKGGTLIYYKGSLHCIPMDPPPLKHLEVSVCRLGMTGHSAVTLVSAYLPPSPNTASEAHAINNAIRDDLNSIFGLSDSVILAGDLNAKHPAWNSSTTNPRGKVVFDLCSTLSFDVIAPMHPTHYPFDPTQRPDVLDIALLRNVNLRLHSLEVIDELDSDHRPVILGLSPRTGPADPDQPPPTRVVTDWGKVSDLLKSTNSPHLDRIPDNIQSAADTANAVDSLTEHVQSVLNECSREVPAVSDHRWSLPDDVRALLSEKNAAVRAYRAFPCANNKTHMRYLQRKVSNSINELREERWSKLLSEIEPTHQAFWNLQRKLRSPEVSTVPPLIRPDKTFAFDDEDKAECLADSLELQCSPSTLPIDPAHLARVDAEVERRSTLPPSEDPDAPLPPVTPDEVADVIKGLHHRKAPGRDGMTNRVFKLLPAQLIVLLTAIFNGALAHNMFPQSWKEAIVIGIPKPGKPRSSPSSYRPISLLSAFGKIYERLIYKRLKDYVEAKSLIPMQQFGFRARHSSVHQAHRIVEFVSDRFQRGMMTGALFFDIAKAFDKVWHNGLIFKLYRLGVPDRLVLILRDFLSNRSFRYRIEGALSTSRPIRAGVPQGAVLSPLLFTLYTSDIPTRPRVQLSLFADDTAIYCSGKNPAQIATNLQNSAAALGDWFRRWRIEVNPDKSQAVLFIKPRSHRPSLPPPITMFGKPIPWEERAKYLGVILDHRLSFREHIKTVRSRAAFALGRLFPMLNARSKLSLKCKLRIYTTCIRPIMTYACPVFAQAHDRTIHRMQTLQNRFLRRATGAPWYLRNDQLHVDLRIPTLKQFMKRLSKRYFDTAEKHSNPLIVSAARYVPSQISRVRRPRHTLVQPDDPITILQESRRETSTLRKNKYRPRSTFRPRRRGPSRRPGNDPPRPLQSEPARAAEPLVES